MPLTVFNTKTRVGQDIDKLLHDRLFLQIWAVMSTRTKRIQGSDQRGDPWAWSMNGITHENLFNVAGLQQEAGNIVMATMAQLIIWRAGILQPKCQTEDMLITRKVE